MKVKSFRLLLYDVLVYIRGSKVRVYHYILDHLQRAEDPSSAWQTVARGSRATATAVQIGLHAEKGGRARSSDVDFELRAQSHTRHCILCSGSCSPTGWWNDLQIKASIAPTTILDIPLKRETVTDTVIPGNGSISSAAQCCP